MNAVEVRRRVLELLDRWDEEHETSGCPAGAGECIHSAAAGIRAVVELHAPSPRRGSEDVCAGCEIKGVGLVWLDRCKTLAVVAEALAVDTDARSIPDAEDATKQQSAGPVLQGSPEDGNS